MSVVNPGRPYSVQVQSVLWSTNLVTGAALICRCHTEEIAIACRGGTTRMTQQLRIQLAQLR